MHYLTGGPNKHIYTSGGENPEPKTSRKPNKNLMVCKLSGYSFTYLLYPTDLNGAQLVFLLRTKHVTYTETASCVCL